MARSSPPARIDVLIESPRFSFIKRDDAGAIALISPLPCPINYGSVPGTRSGDGARVDAIVLGERKPRGLLPQQTVVAVVHFIDAGEDDPKWVCSERELSKRDRAELESFFRLYTLIKRALNRAMGKRGTTRFDGVEQLTT